jgi:hypothetical protein
MIREEMSEERERVREREAKRDEQDRDYRASQDTMLKSTVQAAVTQGLTFVFNTQEFANMMANTVAAVTSKPPVPNDGTGPAPHANPSP